MQNITITLSSEEAETVLFALVLRSKQKGLNPQLQAEASDIAKRFDRDFTKAFGWDASIDRVKLRSRPIKHITIKCYDLAPAE